MADINLTEASVLPGTNAQKQRVNFGATIVQGTVVYLDTADNEYKIADCTGAATDAACGIALSSGADGQPGIIQTAGNLTCDALTAGTVYILSVTGQLCPAADLNLTTDYLTVVGAATSATNLLLGFIVSGYKTP
jgi:hypothetical protein